MSTRRDTTALAVASLVSGGLAYVVFALTTRGLGAVDAAPVSVLWTYWGLAGAAVTFPLQHWLTRVAAAHEGFAAARSMLPAVAGLVAALTALAGAAAWLAREQLFGEDGVVFPALVAAITLGSALMGVLRGGLGARNRFRSLGATILAENGVRCVGVAVLLALGVEDPAAYGIAIAAGHLSGLCWPSALRFPATGRPATTGSGLRLLLGTAGGQLLAQVTLTSGPILLALLGGTPAHVTALFVALAVYRAPYIVALGVVPQLTGRLTLAVVEGRTHEVNRMRLAVVGLCLAFVAGAVPVGLWVGPPLVRLVFGEDVVVPAGTSALLAVGSVLAVANLVASILVIAHARSRRSTVAWLLGLAAAAVVLLAGPADLTRIGWAFVAAEGTAFAVLLLSPRTAARGAGDGP